MTTITPKTPEEIQNLRHACKTASSLLTSLSPLIKPHATTSSIDSSASALVTSLGYTSAPLNYGGVGMTESNSGATLCSLTHNLVHALISTLHYPSWFHPWRTHGFYGGIPFCGFPKSTCISVNDVVCHGVPSNEEVLQEGDLVNVDITVIVGGGWHGDTSRMWIVGRAWDMLEGVDLDEGGGEEGITGREAGRVRLSVVTREAMFVGISNCREGGKVGDIGRSIQVRLEEERRMAGAKRH